MHAKAIMEALKVWLTDSMNIPSFVPHLLARYNTAAKVTHCSNNEALRFDFVITVVNITESYGVMVIQVRDNYTALRKVYEMCKA
jgi:hypothetical protein